MRGGLAPLEESVVPGVRRPGAPNSLSVARESRRQGIGGRLIDYVDAELASRAIRDWRVAATIVNSDAQRLYERRGLQPAEIILYRFAAKREG